MRRWIGAALLAAGLAACGPNMQGLETGETGRVAQIVDGDTLVLDSGLRVTLTGVEAPYGNEPFARDARAGLERLALGREARLGYAGLRRVPPRVPRDSVPSAGASLGPQAAQAATRPAATQTGPAASTQTSTSAEPPRETALAQVFVQSEGGRWIWLQGAMAGEGLAWVRPRSDTARLPQLLAAEREARRARSGLWREGDYRVRTAAAIERDSATYTSNRCGRGPFRLVEGVVRSIGDQHDQGRVFLNFGERYNTDFTVAIYGRDVENWRGPAFSSYEGQRVRVRGHVIGRGGPLICVDNAGMIEVLTAPRS